MINKVLKSRKIDNIDDYLKAFDVVEFVKSVKLEPETWFRNRPGKEILE